MCPFVCGSQAAAVAEDADPQQSSRGVPTGKQRVTTFVLATLLCVALMGGAPALCDALDIGMARDRSAEKGAEFHERAAKGRQYRACYETGKWVCYGKYAEAIKWCRENWQQCLPFIDGIGIHSGAYGKQVLDECKSELRSRCSREAGL